MPDDVLDSFDFDAIGKRLRSLEAGWDESPDTPTVFVLQFEPERVIIERQDHVLAEIAKTVHRSSHYLVEIHGHTDTYGHHGRNMQLAAQRALTVKRALVARGVCDEKIDLFSHGPDRPRPNDTFDSGGNPKNRRVEVRVISA